MPRTNARPLRMQSNRRIIVPSQPAGEPATGIELNPRVAQAGAELTALWQLVDECRLCGRCSEPRAHSTGTVDADVLLLSESPTDTDVEAGMAFTSEAEAMFKAFEALGIPLDRLRGATAVRCGSGPANSDQVAACSPHLLQEVLIVDPRVIVAFGPLAVDAVAALDSWCGIEFGGDWGPGVPIQIAPRLWLLPTEPLSSALADEQAKRRLWSHLKKVPEMLEKTR